MNAFALVEQRNSYIIFLYNQGRLKAVDVYLKIKLVIWEELMAYQGEGFIKSEPVLKKDVIILNVKVSKIMETDE